MDGKHCPGTVLKSRRGVDGQISGPHLESFSGSAASHARVWSSMFPTGTFGAKFACPGRPKQDFGVIRVAKANFVGSHVILWSIACAFRKPWNQFS